METFVDLGSALPDLSRPARCGRPETIFCPGKTAEQVAAIAEVLYRRHGCCLGTRAELGQVEAVQALVAKWSHQPAPVVRYEPLSRVLRLGQAPRCEEGWRVGVVSAGTADQAVANEAAEVVDFFGWEVLRVADVGVAGLHRLLARLDEIKSCQVLIVVAGMEGALPSVVGGLVSCPVIAVPTSVGYGAGFQGLAPLLAMLNSCAAGITVCNIDNGFGAACAADAILRMASAQRCNG